MNKIIELMDSLHRVMSAANEIMTSSKKPALTLGDLQTLVVVVRGGVQGPAKLARLRGISSAAMTGSIDALERKRLITREYAPHDRRVIPIRLTRLGISVIKAASEEI